MCGPFVALLQTRKDAGIISNIFYNMGRTLSYSLVGFGLGFLGWGANQFLFAEIAGWIGGLVIIILGLSYIFPVFPQLFHWSAPRYITNFAAKRLKNTKNTIILSFAMGSISGLLPCGLLLPAYGLSLLTGNPWEGALVMAVFSLGTYPMLLSIGLAGQKFISFLSNQRYRLVLGIVLVLFGLFTIYTRATMEAPEEECHTPTDVEVEETIEN
jgi:uncharacterized protein